LSLIEALRFRRPLGPSRLYEKQHSQQHGRLWIFDLSIDAESRVGL